MMMSKWKEMKMESSIEINTMPMNREKDGGNTDLKLPADLLRKKKGNFLFEIRFFFVVSGRSEWNRCN